MDISGIIQSYDSRGSSSVAGTRAVMAPQYSSIQPYTGSTSNTLVASHQQIQHNPFSFSPYSAGTTNGLIPAFANNYIQQRPQPHLIQPATNGSRGVAYARNDQQSFIDKQSRSPAIKAEPLWTAPPSIPPFNSMKPKTVTANLATGTTHVNFGTEVDTLMKAIQAKSQVVPPQTSSPVAQCRPVVGAPFTPPYAQTASQGGMQTGEESQFKLTGEDIQDGTSSPKESKKRYHCTIKGCGKSFYQKTHLDIHVRAHTGVKPYHCKEPNCGRTFSQLGNLKTHERRHTGERPYPCEICGKRFAQRGNVRAHKIVHDQAKPYLCRLDDCGKQFTQLGNLKSHQNKFHIATIRNLTSKFASIKDGDIINSTDKKLWEYFANLYKNSNKGIKGRGKDRKVGPHSMALNSSMRNLGVGGSGYSMNGAGRGSMVVDMMGAGMKVEGAGQGRSQYEMFDADDESQAGSHSGGSSVGTCYDDAPSVGFEDNGRTGELAFGDRIY